MRILLLSPIAPFPTRTGAEQRTQLLYRALSEVGEVDLLVVTEGHEFDIEAEVRDRLQRDFGLVRSAGFPSIDNRWPWRVFRYFGRSWPARLAKVIEGPSAEFAAQVAVRNALADQLKRNQYSLIVSRYLLPFAVARPDSTIPCIVDVDDFPSEVVARRASQAANSSIGSLYWRLLSRRTKRMEARLLVGCRHALVAKQSDLALAGSCPASVVPNIPFAREGTPELPIEPTEAKSGRILFMGTLGWKPNELAVDSFLQNCWSDIRRAVPHAALRVVGYGMSDAMRNRWGAIQGVEPIGFVDSVQHEYMAAEFAICPVEEGGGSNIKVLEALKHGKTVVCTTWGARGYEESLVEQQAIIVAENPFAFSEACIQLLREPARARAMAERGRRVVAGTYSYDAFRQAVHRAVEVALT